MNYFCVILSFIFFILIKEILKVIKLLIKNLKQKIIKNKIDKTKVNKDFVLDKPNLIYKLIDDIYDGDCSKMGSRGKTVIITIENYEMEIDNIAIIPHRHLYSTIYDGRILISSEDFFKIQKECSRKDLIFSKTHIPQPFIVKYPFFTNKSCEQYKIILTNLKPYVDETRSYRGFESNRYILSFGYCP